MSSKVTHLPTSRSASRNGEASSVDLEDIRALVRPDLAGVDATIAARIENDKHIDAAVFIEFVHTATLLHDDVVDGSQKRRGRATANNIFGNQARVLVGD